MVGNVIGLSVTSGSSVTRFSDMVLPHYLEISGVGNNGEKFVPVSNLKAMTYQHWIFFPLKMVGLVTEPL